MTTGCNGLPVDSSSRILITDLGAGAVPASSPQAGGWTFSTVDGSLYVTTDAAAAQVYVRGLAFRADGALFVQNAATSSPVYVDGLACAADGSVFISKAGTIDHAVNGYPMTSADRLVTS